MAKPSRSARRSAIIAVAAIACIPLLYGGALVWANQDPIGRLDQVPAAVVNLDQPTVAHGQTVDLGTTITRNLVGSESADNFDWTTTDAASAQRGLASGEYLAVLTLPAQLSSDAVSTGSDDPADARATAITITTNDAQNYIVGTIAKSVGTAVASSASAEVSKQYLDQVYLGFNDLSGKLGQAASGARELSAGAATLAAGTAELSTGAQQSSAGASSLASGLGTLASGAHSLSGGVAQLSSGATSLASGTGSVADGAKSLASGTATLSAGAKQLSSGTTALASGADALNTGLAQLTQQTAGLPASSTALSTGASQLADGVTQYTQGVDQLAAACAPLAASPDPAVQQLCAGIEQVAGAHGADGNANSVQLLDGAAQLKSGSAQLASSAPALTTAVAQLASGAASLDSGAASAASGASELADGAASAASGAAKLADGATAVHDGATTLANGAADAASGARSLDSGAASAASGATALASGARQLASGAASAHAGAAQLATGSSTLASKLVDGESAVPNYTKAQRALLSNAASQPVKLTAAHDNAVPGYGYGLAPYFLSLGLWVGGMGIYMVLRALPKRLVDRGAPAWWSAVAGWLRGAAIGAVQAVLMYAVVVFAVGVHPAHPIGLLGMLLLASAAFTALNHAFVTLFGSRGRFAGLILIVLQLASAGGTYPIQTAPGVFQAIHGWLPISYSVEAFRSLIAGGSAGVAQTAIVLSVWLVGAVAASVAVTVRRRMRGVELLQPDFAL